MRIMGAEGVIALFLVVLTAFPPLAMADGGRSTERCEVGVCARVDAYDHGSCPGFGNRALGVSSSGVSVGTTDSCQSASRTTAVGASAFLASVVWSSGSGTQSVAVCSPTVGCVTWVGQGAACAIRFYSASGPVTGAPLCPVGPPAVPALPYDTMPFGAVPYDAVPWELIP